ncbi:hypothetical protein H4R34_004551 [Dimargaris verticillata]|uniref:Uncharacterized protein n=1 Tax=Dimargaris verticillata TaxID=2761393 RepID=A0A9W8AY28_9FUNG|nr:hypothetical protein H4R34_004551 [Dimargaris verticillata]
MHYRSVSWSTLVGWMACLFIGTTGALAHRQAVRDSLAPVPDTAAISVELKHTLAAVTNEQANFQARRAEKLRRPWLLPSPGQKSSSLTTAVFALLYPLVQTEFTAFVNELLETEKKRIKHTLSWRRLVLLPFRNKPQFWYKLPARDLGKVDPTLFIKKDGEHTVVINPHTMALPATYQSVPLLAAVQQGQVDVLLELVSQLEQTFRQLHSKATIAKIQAPYRSLLKKYMHHGDFVAYNNNRLFISYYVISEIIATLVVSGDHEKLIAFLQGRAHSEFIVRHIRFAVMLMVVLDAGQHRPFLDSLRMVTAAYTSPGQVLNQLQQFYRVNTASKTLVPSNVAIAEVGDLAAPKAPTSLLKPYFDDKSPFAAWERTPLDLGLSFSGRQAELQEDADVPAPHLQHPLPGKSRTPVPAASLGVAYIIQCIGGLNYQISESSLEVLQALADTPGWKTHSPDDQACYQYLGFSPVYIRLTPGKAQVTLLSKVGLVLP